MDVELLLDKAQNAFSLLVEKIDRLSIWDRSKFPFWWRKAAKWRTVWRIVEELITQNLEKYHSEFWISEIIVSDSEVSIFDMMCKFDWIDIPVYFNIKSAVQWWKINKDDLSKAEGLISFYEGDINRHYFVATFVISFNDDMTIWIEKAVVFPLAWIPDIYINPSNNWNMQSSKYKDISTAVKRNNQDFFNLLKSEYLVAKGKKAKKSLN